MKIFIKVLLKILSVLVCIAFAGICFYSAYRNFTIAHYGNMVFQAFGGLLWLNIIRYCFNWINKKF